MSPLYWKPKYGTRASRHRAWVKQQARREAEQARGRVPLRVRLRRLLHRG